MTARGRAGCRGAGQRVGGTDVAVAVAGLVDRIAAYRRRSVEAHWITGGRQGELASGAEPESPVSLVPPVPSTPPSPPAMGAKFAFVQATA